MTARCQECGATGNQPCYDALQLVIVGPAVMPYDGVDANRRPVPTTWPLYEAVESARGRCGPHLGELWHNPRTGRWSVYLVGQGVMLADHPDKAGALTGRGMQEVE